MIIQNIHSDTSEVPQEASASCGDFPNNKKTKSHPHPYRRSLNLQSRIVTVPLESFTDFEGKNITVSNECAREDKEMDFSGDQGTSNKSHESLVSVDSNNKGNNDDDMQIVSDVSCANPALLGSNETINKNKHINSSLLKDSDLVNTSSNTIYSKNLQSLRRKYNSQDKSPYVVHVQSRDDVLPSAHHPSSSYDLQNYFKV